MEGAVKLAVVVVTMLGACAGNHPEVREPIIVTPTAVPFVPLQVSAADDAGASRTVSRLPTYEEAIAAPAPEVPPGTPDLTDGQLAGPMRDSAFLERCGVPESSKLTVKIVVQGGKAVGLSLRLSPDDEAARRCVEEYVRTLAWPVGPRRDFFTTAY